jgi:hypothetical protein
MGTHGPFGHLKHKLWPKEGPRGIKLAIWFSTTKSQESFRFPCVQVVCDISLENSQRGLQICFKRHFNQRSTYKIMGPQSHGSPSCGNFGSPETKWHLGVSPMVKHRVYYKEEGGGFLQVRAMVSLMNPCLLVPRPCTKVLQLCINQLVVWFVQVCVSKWIARQSSSSHLKL